jgi:hypothetical protein
MVRWSDESPFMLFPTSKRVYVWRIPKGAYNLECIVPTVKHRRRFLVGLGSNIMKQYSVVAIITTHGRITAREYLGRLGNEVHPMIQM